MPIQEKWEPKEYKQLQSSIDIMSGMLTHAKQLQAKKSQISVDEDYVNYLERIVPNMIKLMEKNSEEITDADLRVIIADISHIVNHERDLLRLEIDSELNTTETILHQLNTQLNLASQGQKTTLDKMKKNIEAIRENRYDPKGLQGIIWAIEAQKNIILDEPELNEIHKKMLSDIESRLNAIYQSPHNPTSKELVQITDYCSNKMMDFFNEFMKKKGNVEKNSEKDIELLNSLAGVRNELQYISRQAPVLHAIEKIENLKRQAKKPSLKKLFTHTAAFFKQWHHSVKAKHELKQVTQELLSLGFRHKETKDWDQLIKKDGGLVVHHFSQGNLATMGSAGGLCYGFSGDWALNFIKQDHTQSLNPFTENMHKKEMKISPEIARIYAKQYSTKKMDLPEGQSPTDAVAEWLNDPDNQNKAIVLGINAPTGGGHALGIGKNQHGYWLHDSNHGTLFFPQKIGNDAFIKALENYRQERYPEMQIKSLHNPEKLEQTQKLTHYQMDNQKAQEKLKAETDTEVTPITPNHSLPRPE